MIGCGDGGNGFGGGGGGGGGSVCFFFFFFSSVTLARGLEYVFTEQFVQMFVFTKRAFLQTMQALLTAASAATTVAEADVLSLGLKERIF